jgi:hypothetical protein
MMTVRLFSRRRNLRQARQLARLLVALDDAAHDRRNRLSVAPVRRSARATLTTR